MTTADALLRDADFLLSEKRYADCLITLSAALEVALATSLSSMLVRDPGSGRNATPAEVQLLNKRYMATIGTQSLRGLCNIAIQVMTRQLHVRTIAEAFDVIERSKRFGTSVPTPEQIKAIKDANARAAVEALRDCAIVDLRNAVVHQSHDATEEDAIEQRKAGAAHIAAVQAVYMACRRGGGRAARRAPPRRRSGSPATSNRGRRPDTP